MYHLFCQQTVRACVYMSQSSRMLQQIKFILTILAQREIHQKLPFSAGGDNISKGIVSCLHVQRNVILYIIMCQPNTEGCHLFSNYFQYLP